MHERLRCDYDVNAGRDIVDMATSGDDGTQIATLIRILSLKAWNVHGYGISGMSQKADYPVVNHPVELTKCSHYPVFSYDIEGNELISEGRSIIETGLKGLVTHYRAGDVDAGLRLACSNGKVLANLLNYYACPVFERIYEGFISIAQGCQVPSYDNARLVGMNIEPSSYLDSYHRIKRHAHRNGTTIEAGSSTTQVILRAWS
jgi:hypothetical protein